MISLEAEKGFPRLSVEQGHVDVEDAHQAVGLILDLGSLSVHRPRHPLRNTSHSQGFTTC